MDTGAQGTDVGARTGEDDRWVVVLRGSRPHARLYGSVAGPSVLAPGPDDGQWQVLRVLSDVPAPAIVHGIRFPPTPEARFGIVDPAALALRRTADTRTLVVPTGPSTCLSWTWTRHTRASGDTDDLKVLADELADELVALGDATAPADVRAVLVSEWTDRDPVRELVALLGLPVTAPDILEVPDADAPRLGEVLLPADKHRHSKALVRAMIAAGRPSWAELAAEAENNPRPRLIDRIFGVMWMLLGTVISLLGLLCVVLGIRPEASVLGVSSPPALVVMGAVIAWFGTRQWRRGATLAATTSPAAGGRHT